MASKKKKEKNTFDDDFITALDLLPDVIIIKDAERRWIKANKKALEIFRIEKEDYKGKRDEELAEHYPDFKKFLPDYLASDLLAWETNQQVKAEEFILFNRKEYLFEVIKTPFFYPSGERKGIVVTCRDITEREKAKKELAESEEKYRIILENTKDLIAVYNDRVCVTYASPSYEHVLGIKSEEIVGTDGANSIHPEDKKAAFEALTSVFSTNKSRSIVIRLINKEKSYSWIEAKLQPVMHKNKVTSVVIVSRDITKRKTLEEQLKHMAYHDVLTGVGNRRLVINQLEEMIKEAKQNNESFSVMALDFDRFKWVNDTLGHHIGDKLLMQFAERISGCVRSIDRLARIGGDEFIILLPHVYSNEEVIHTANGILSALQEPWKINEHEFIITTSIGIAEFPQCGDDVASIMKAADKALYKAKQAGRNNYQFYTPNCLAESEEMLVNDLRKALEQKEFYMVYQPKYSLSTKKVSSIEALIRWDHPQKGLIPPNEFIPLAEQHHLIVPITNWVLEQISVQIQRWQKLKFDLAPVSVNVSAKHFEKGTLLEDIKKIVHKTGLNPSMLILEITESIMMENPEAAIETIRQLRAMGIKIAIDDFGTGFSSLSYLVKLPVDLLKLDKSFIDELTNQNNISFVNSIVTLAHNLNLLVVAEGIETENQHQVLSQNGCDIGQGYFFSKPLMDHEFQRAFLTNTEPK